MNKEKIQYIFIYTVVGVFVLVMIGLLIYTVLGYTYLARAKKDPTKKVYVEKIENTLNKSEKDLSIDDYIGVGNDYLSLKQYNKAIDYYKMAMKKGQSSVANENIAEVYKILERHKDAEIYYFASLDVDPMTANVYIKLHDLYTIPWEGKKYDPGSILELAYTRIPDDADILVNMALYYKEIGNRAKAIEFFKKTILANPSNDAARQELLVLEKS